MLALIAKDITVQKRSLLLFVLAGLFMTFVFSMTDEAGITAMVMPVFVVGYSYASRSLYEDEKNHALRLILAFPLARKQIVRAKYVSIALVFLPLTVGFWLLGRPLGFISDSWELAVLQLSAVILAFAIVVSFFLPIAFKLGMIRAQTLQRFVILGLFAFGMAGGYVFTRLGNNGSGPPEWLKNFSNHISRLSPSRVSLVLLLAAVLIYVLSAQLAVRFFERRELF
ncbi:ABC-2 transporter permease [Gorillibacterium sp. CAU 1737]|uniref:ABC-2 transporter permease n=1 Tax=Gorillibacterium sp. CAU 1737 TaxID=3140362 RepID=UPI0032603A15